MSVGLLYYLRGGAPVRAASGRDAALRRAGLRGLLSPLRSAARGLSGAVVRREDGASRESGTASVPMAVEKALLLDRAAVLATLVWMRDCAAGSVEVGGESSALESPWCGPAVDSPATRAHPRAADGQTYIRSGRFEGLAKHAPSVRAQRSRASVPRSARRTAAEHGSRRRARGAEWGSPGGLSVSASRTAPRAQPRVARAGPRVLRRAAGLQSALHARARTPRAVRRGVRRSTRVQQRSTSSAAARAGDAAWVGLSIVVNERLSREEKEEKNGQARLVDESPLCGQRL